MKINITLKSRHALRQATHMTRVRWCILPADQEQGWASEEPVDLLRLRVQVDVVETRPGGQAGDRGHLGLGEQDKDKEIMFVIANKAPPCASITP